MIYEPDKKHISIASLGKEIYNRTICNKWGIKRYAMTGWRIGFTAAPKEVAKCISALQSHMTSNPKFYSTEGNCSSIKKALRNV